MAHERTVGTLLLLALVTVTALLGSRAVAEQANSQSKAHPVAAKRPASPAAQLARGRYLVNNVGLCFECHSQTNWKDPLTPPLPGKTGAGAPFPDKGIPYTLYCPNITPDRQTGIRDLSDQEIGRAIREGIGRDGGRLSPVMPYMFFRAMSDEDLAAVIAYLRSILAVRHAVPKNDFSPEVKATFPPPMPLEGPIPPPDMSDPIKRGAYMVTVGICGHCHTPLDQQGNPRMDLDLAGGFILDGPWGRVASANITADASGISYYDQALFLQVMRTGKVRARKLNPIMPWGHFRNMTNQDLEAIFAYLRTAKRVKHTVDNTEPPTYCKVCGGLHGYGDRN